MKFFDFPTGLLLGAVFVLLVCWALDSDVAPYLDPEDPTRFWAVIGSFIAAMSVVTVAIYQARYQSKLRDQERSKKLDASRAVLPLALSRLSNTALEGYQIALDTDKIRKDPDNSFSRLQKLSISAEDMSVLRDCIEYSEKPAGTWLSLIPAHFQFLRARLESNVTDNRWVITQDQIALAAIDWLELRAFCHHLFTFARTGIEPPEFLAKSSISVPVNHFLPIDIEDQLGTARQIHMDYIETSGGFSAQAYKNRLSV